MLPSFERLRTNYPTESRPDLFHRLGGQWPSLVDKPNYRNTCAVRLSVALKESGVPIPSAYREAMEGDGSPLVLKVSTMREFVRSVFGTSGWGMSKQPGVPIGPSDVPQQTGIIVYHVAWDDATGHFDLWTGRDFVGSGSLEHVKEGYSIELWPVP